MSILTYQERTQLQKGGGAAAAGNRTAEVVAVEGRKMYLRFAGEEEASGKPYMGTCLAGVGERVVCIPISGTYLVIGVILE